MGRRLNLVPVVLVAISFNVAAGDEAAVHHDLKVRLSPADQTIAVVDGLRFSEPAPWDAQGGLQFALHAGLEPGVTSPGWRLERLDEQSSATFLGINATSDSVNGDLPLEVWRLVAG